MTKGKNVSRFLKTIEGEGLTDIGKRYSLYHTPSFKKLSRSLLNRLDNAIYEISICAISGPVGTYNSIDPSVEKYVASKLNFKCEDISTQIIPRDRHAYFFSILSIIASSIERVAIEIRNLQRTEILEVEEFFDKNQKGSSAMPHKRNPVLSENLTGVARYIRSSIIPFLENVALWHERDISHSSVERILAPDITIAVDFALNRLNEIIKNLKIYPKNMKKNLNYLNGIHKSQNLLLLLTKKGLSRQKAYTMVQKIAMESWNNNKKFDELVLKNKEIIKYINKEKIESIFKKEDFVKNIDKIYRRIK